MCFKKMIEPSKEYLYFVARVLFGLLFALHGMQKLGNFSSVTGLYPIFGSPVLGTIVAYAELLIGLGILFGVLTRLSAVGGIIVMAVAYFGVHASGGFNPLVNKGEPALLYLAVFLAVLAYGAGKWSLERAIFKKELLW